MTYFFIEMSAGQLHETLKQRILQLSDQDQIEILSNIEVLLYRLYYMFRAANFFFGVQMYCLLNTLK